MGVGRRVNTRPYMGKESLEGGGRYPKGVENINSRTRRRKEARKTQFWGGGGVLNKGMGEIIGGWDLQK